MMTTTAEKPLAANIPAVTLWSTGACLMTVTDVGIAIIDGVVVADVDVIKVVLLVRPSVERAPLRSVPSIGIEVDKAVSIEVCLTVSH